MTKKELEEFCGMKAECESIADEIEMLYNLVKAINFSENIKLNSSKENSTEYQILRIMDLKDKLEKKRNIMLEYLESIDAYVDSIENGEIRAIIRYHYILGNSWTATSFKVFGVYSYDIPRKKIDRFFENN